MAQPFDAVLLIAFGGPDGPEAIRPFLQNVLRGRRVAAERIEEVAHHYELFGGVSPITALTRRQAADLAARLSAEGPSLPVFVGMRNWHPFLEDTLGEMTRAGVRRAIGVTLAAHRSYSGCTQYRENVRDAQRALRSRGVTPPEVVYAGDWHTHQGFVDAWVAHIERAAMQLPATLRSEARLVFTAHSIPRTMAERYPYQEQLLESARLIAGRLGANDWTLVFQSRSGRPDHPWLEPDVCDYIRQEASPRLRAAIVAPIGFVSDHIEVLYDLDREAAEVCRQSGVAMVRAAAPNADPMFIDTLAAAVRDTWTRYLAGRPLPLAMP